MGKPDAHASAKGNGALTDARLKILVVDDSEQNLTLVSRYLEQMGHEPIPARDGKEAVQRYLAEGPNVVLMDVMMPEMDGYEATARIRALASDQWVPIIFLSALAHQKDILRGLEAGGDDYLTKPIDLLLLGAKIRAMQRIARLQKQLREKAAELERYYDHAEAEKRVGTHLMEHLVSDRGLQDPLVRYWIAPAEHFSGDLVAAARTPGNELHVMLADAAGHGLAAALTVLPLTQVFYAMTEKGFSVSSIVEELNTKIRAIMPRDHFVAATIMSIKPWDHVIEVWNGGNPAPVFLSNDGAVLRRWPSRHVPLGILDRAAFDPHPEIFQYDEAGQLFLFSDGVLEAENVHGGSLGAERIGELLSKTPPERRFENLLETLKSHLGGKPAHDDASLLVVEVPGTDVPKAADDPSRQRRETRTAQWQFQLSLGPSELKTVDAVPLLTHLLTQVGGAGDHTSQIFLVLSELFNNALDHGILRLDSTLKTSPGGFEAYLRERAKRLEELTEGNIEIALELLQHPEQPALKVRIKDSGSGFDHRAFLDAIVSENKPHGRGIFLVRSLGAKLEYHGCGNDAVAIYPL